MSINRNGDRDRPRNPMPVDHAREGAGRSTSDKSEPSHDHPPAVHATFDAFAGGLHDIGGRGQVEGFCPRLGHNGLGNMCLEAWSSEAASRRSSSGHMSEVVLIDTILARPWVSVPVLQS